MKVITAPENYKIQPNDICCFLAGGISGCPDWQKEVIRILQSTSFDDLVMFNPRRDTFDPNADESEIYEQIEWEFEYLNKIDIFSMYFCKETIQPICMYELGRYIEVMKRRFPEDYIDRIIISVDPEYKRNLDVIVQANLALECDSDHLPHIFAGLASYKCHADEIIDAFLTIRGEIHD